MNGSGNGYASYKVAASGRHPRTWGLGVYCDFKNAAVVADDAFDAPVATGVHLHQLTTVWLNGFTGSAINHVVNSTGNAVMKGSPIATASLN